MAPAVPVELKAHDPLWADSARREGERLKALLGDVLVDVHHIGSTSIPGIVAKPTLDLLGVVRTLEALEARRAQVESAGYDWWAEFGLAGRRYCTLTDKATGKRTIHLHCYQRGDPGITRHLAFRDYLKSRPDIAAEYEAMKLACQQAHPLSSHDYSLCKGDWIQRVEAEALARSG